MDKRSPITPKPTEKRINVFSEALHRGESQSDAYREMHPVSQRWKPETVHNKASKWAKVGEVVAKVAELRKEASKRNQTSVDLLDKMHKSAFQVAKEMKNPSAMTTAAKNLGDLHGINANKKTNVTRDQQGNEKPMNAELDAETFLTVAEKMMDKAANDK